MNENFILLSNLPVITILRKGSRAGYENCQYATLLGLYRIFYGKKSCINGNVIPAREMRNVYVFPIVCFNLQANHIIQANRIVH